MTTVSASGTAGSLPAVRRPADALTAAVDLLGGDREAVHAQLRAGKSLADVARSRGVSQRDLLRAMRGSASVERSAAPPAVPGDAAPAGPGGDDAGTPATRRTTGSGKRAPVTPQQQQRLARLSAALGTQPAALLDQLLSGRSLAGIAAEHGVDPAALSGMLQKGDLLSMTV